MSAIQLPSVVRMLNLFVDGRGYAGKIDEVTLPKLAIKTDDYRPGGLDTSVEYDMGMEKLEIGFAVSGVNVDLFRSFGILGGGGLPLTVRGSLQRQGDPTPQAVVFNLHGTFREIDMGALKPGERNTMTVSGGLTYYAATIDGVQVVKIDALNAVREIDGVDQLAAHRANIGL